MNADQILAELAELLPVIEQQHEREQPRAMKRRTSGRGNYLRKTLDVDEISALFEADASSARDFHDDGNGASASTQAERYDTVVKLSRQIVAHYRAAVGAHVREQDEHDAFDEPREHAANEPDAVAILKAAARAGDREAALGLAALGQEAVHRALQHGQQSDPSKAAFDAVRRRERRGNR